MSGGANNYKYLSKTLQENLAIGRYSNVYFGPVIGETIMLNPLAEYQVPATNVVPTAVPMPNTAAMPSFGENDDLPF